MLLILANGRVWSPGAGPADAIGVRDGRIAAVGSLAEVRAALPGAEELDVQHGSILPGLADAHGHVLMLGESRRRLDLRGCRSVDELVDLVEARARALPAASWVLGYGWDQNRFRDGAWPTRAQLDRVAPDHPVLLERVDGHAVCVNGRALALSGIDRNTPEPDGGRIVRDPRGEPTGVLVDRAATAVSALVPEPDEAQREAMLLDALRHCLSLGLTCVHDMALDPSTWLALKRLEDRGDLPIRVRAYAEAGLTRRGEPLLEGDAASQAGSHRLRLCGAKLFLDGALGSRGAALLDPYSDEPDNRGLLLESAAVAERIAGFLERGWQVALHAIGDRAVRLGLEAVERAFSSARSRRWGDGATGGSETTPAPRRPPAMPAVRIGDTGCRPRIRLEHAQVMAAQDRQRLAASGVVASMQPVHAVADAGWVEERLGAARLADAYCWRELRQAGAVLAFGSDFPIEDPNPMGGLVAASAGLRAGGAAPPPWLVEHCIERAGALEAFTRGAAYASGDEAHLGELRPGMAADVVVLDRDPLSAEPEALLEARPLLTLVDGAFAWRR